MKTLKTFWHASRNFGDTLTPIVVAYLTGQDIQYAHRKSTGKLIAIGSVMTALRKNDVVWGTGSIRAGHKGCIKQPDGSKFLAVRGPLTRELIDGDVPEIYGDPGILMPLIYDPAMEKRYAIGYMPHHIDREILLKKMKFGGEIKFIDIMQDWDKVIEEMNSCEMIVTSSLHGIVCSDAYGIPVRWEKYSDNVIGGEFKFQDYFLGTGRERHNYGDIIKPITNLKERQDILINALINYYGKK